MTGGDDSFNEGDYLPDTPQLPAHLLERPRDALRARGYALQVSLATTSAVPIALLLIVAAIAPELVFASQGSSNAVTSWPAIQGGLALDALTSARQ